MLSLAVVEARSSKVSPALSEPLRASSPGAARSRNRLAGDRRLIDHRERAHDHAVDRNDLAGAHQNVVADRDFLDGYVFDGRGAAAMGDFRRAIDQRSKVAFGAGDGKILEQIAARIHDGNNDAGKILAKRDRARHRNESDRINADAAGHKIPDHRDQEPDDDREGAGGPAPIRPFATIDHPCDQSERQARDRNREQCAAKKSLVGR